MTSGFVFDVYRCLGNHMQGALVGLTSTGCIIVEISCSLVLC